MESAYLQLALTGELRARVESSFALLAGCTLCPRRCGVNRLRDERGFCGIGRYAEVASFGPHFGEEAPLVGSHGSGTIFFCGCNLGCVFCQNSSISHGTDEDCTQVDAKALGKVMITLQQQGCHNINLVTPTHVVPQFLEALEVAVELGLTIPIIYNCGGYESVHVLPFLDGIIDIYMPDFKFWDMDLSATFLQAEEYPEIARKAIAAMYDQVGDLQMNVNGIAERGLLVRHLLMPNQAQDSLNILRFLAHDLSKECYVNIMDQYRPAGSVGRNKAFPELIDPISPAQYEETLAAAKSLGLSRIYDRDFRRLLQSLIKKT